MVTSSSIYTSYAVIILIAGFIGFALGNFSSRASSSLITSGVTALFNFLLAYLTKGTVGGGAVERTGGKLARQVGPVSMLLMSGVFGWRAALAAKVVEKLYLFHLLSAMSAVSVLGFIALVMFAKGGKSKTK